MDGPLFIVGAPHSGTSLLHRVLALHPRAAWISNYSGGIPALPEIAVLNRLGPRAPRQRRRAWFVEEGDRTARPDPEHWLDRRFPRPAEAAALFAPGSEQRLARIARASGGRVLVARCGDHNRRLHELALTFPDSRFVVVSRHGRDVAQLLLRSSHWQRTPVWWWGDTPAAWVAAGGDQHELAALHWVREVLVIEQGLAGVSPRRVLRVGFESLVRTPADVLAGTAVWAGLGDDPDWHAELAQVRFPPRNGLARRDDDERIGAIQEGALRALGYRP